MEQSAIIFAEGSPTELAGRTTLVYQRMVNDNDGAWSRSATPRASLMIVAHVWRRLAERRRGAPHPRPGTRFQTHDTSQIK